MSIYTMKPCFKNGKVMKRVIVFFEAKNPEEAYQAFGAGEYWSGYHENICFDAQLVAEVPNKRTIVSASLVIKKSIIH